MAEKEKLIYLKSKVEKLTDDLKNKPLYSFDFIEKYDIDILNSMNIRTFGELLEVNTDQLYQKLKEYGRPEKYFEIRKIIMKNGFLFNDDRLCFQSLGINDEVALIPITNLSISNRLKNAFTRWSICYFGDLLSLDYKHIKEIRAIGNLELIELKKYVHSLGYLLKGEEEELIEIKERYKRDGIPMIQEELNLDGKVSGILYRNKIYTVQDLIDFGEEVFRLVGMGVLNKERLKVAMKSKNIHFKTDFAGFGEDFNTSAAFMPKDEDIEQLKKQNHEIQSRIEQKEQLLQDLNALIEERISLTEREIQLDEEIDSKIKSLQAIRKGTK